MGPLDGIKVLDLTSMVSGPVAAMMLGDQGADVIKVEPLYGEQLRHLGEKHNDISATFYSCNRNKRSLALDLKTTEGQAVLWQLIEKADVLLQNFRPGAIERMGFGEEKVRQRNLGIIFVSISGFGEDGPYAHKRVYDPIIQGLSGATDIQANRETGRPGMFRIIIADKISALTAAQAVSSALFHRERFNEGQHIKLSMLGATVAFFWPEGMNGLTFAEKKVDHSKNFSSLDLVYESKDGFITLSTVSDKEWQALCAALKRDDLLTDKRFATAIARRENTKERRAIVGAEIEQHPTRELLELLDSHDVPCAPLLNREELLNHPQILESNTIAREIIPGFGEVRQPVPAAQFQLTQSSLRIPAPKLGQHSSEILEELGYSPANCAELINANVIVQA